jgi:hypothetical protein
MPAGRPTDYNEAIALKICIRIAGDESLESICRDPDMPASSTVRQWKAKYPEFAANYARAREEQGHTAADTLSDLRKKVLAGEVPPDVARVAADMIKWESARRAPKNFGDKIDLTHSGPDGGPVKQQLTLDPSNLSTEALRELYDAAKANQTDQR